MADNIYDEFKKHFDENGIIDIPDETSFWMIRTQGGEFYDEFISKGFIALGWNDLTPELIKRSNDNEAVKDNTKQFIEEEYESKQPGHVFNRCDKFINELSIGDFVIIPSKNSDVIAFAKITSDCYIEENLTVSETEYNLEVGLEYEGISEDLECPFNKRRKVDVLKTMEKQNVSPMIYKAMTSYQSLNHIEHYDTDILSSIYKIYNYKGSMYLNFNVKKESNIRAIDYSGFIHSTTLLISHYTDDEIFVKSNVNSPGLITFIKTLSSEALDFLNPKMFPLFIIYVIAFGGKLGSIEINSLYDIWKNKDDKKLDNRKKEVDIEKSEVEIEVMKYELEKKKREDSPLDPIVRTLISTAENLEIYDQGKKNQSPNEEETDD